MCNRAKPIKISVSLVLTLSLASSGVVQARQDDPEGPESGVTQTQRYAFLMAVADRLELMLHSTRGRLDRVKTCYTMNPYDETECALIRKEHAADVRIEYPTFKRNVFHLTLFSRANMIRLLDLFKQQSKTTRPKYIEIDDWQIPLRRVESLTRLPRYKYSPEEIRSILTNAPGTIQHVGPDGATVNTRFPNTFAGNMDLLCQKFHDWSRLHGLKTYYFRGLERNPMCDRFQLTYVTSQGFTFKTVSLSQDEQRFFNYLEYWLVNRNDGGEVIKHRQDIEDRYFFNASLMPHVALLESTSYSQQTMYSILENLETNVIDEIRDLTGRRKAFAEREKGQGRSVDLSSLYELMSYSKIVESVSLEPDYNMGLLPETDWTAVAKDLDRLYSKQQLVRSGMEMGGLVLGTAACFFPARYFVGLMRGLPQASRWAVKYARAKKVVDWGLRGLSLKERTDKAIAWAICADGIIGVGSAYYFYHKSQMEWDRAYRRVFAQEQGQELLAELRSLPEAEFYLAVDMLTFPVGNVLGSSIYRLVKSKISVKSQGALLKFLEDARKFDRFRR